MLKGLLTVLLIGLLATFTGTALAAEQMVEITGTATQLMDSNDQPIGYQLQPQDNQQQRFHLIFQTSQQEQAFKQKLTPRARITVEVKGTQGVAQSQNYILVQQWTQAR